MEVNGGSPIESTAESTQENTLPLVFVFILARMVINATYRMIYPFLRIFAAGLGVPLQMALLPLTGRSFVGVFGPLLAPVADRFGRKVGMLLGLGIYTLGVGLVVVRPSFPTFFLALVLANLGNQVFLPAMQAYLGDRVPYRRRGRVLALTELSWSLSFILLVPLVGLLIGRLGWTAPFWALTGLGLLSILLILWQVPADRVVATSQPTALWRTLKQVLTTRAALVALSFGLLITLANEVVNSVFGVWMSDAFGLNLAALGLAATVIGLAELSGEGATAALVDWMGKKRAVGIGLAVTSLASLALPWLGQSLWGGVFGLFLFYLGFEFTLVSYIPVMTEVMPHARATLMAANLAAFSLGRALGAPLGLWLYPLGFGANALAALLLNGLALLALLRVRVED
jgi:MFS transporter, DHA1 family, inner membrane transport protein